MDINYPLKILGALLYTEPWEKIMDSPFTIYPIGVL